MKFVAVVPVKLNNQRLPGKNLKPMADGQPMMAHLLHSLQLVDSLAETYVYCSSEEIRDLVESTGATFLRRDAGLDSDTTKSNDILQAFTNDVHADAYVLAHATSPFTSPMSVRDGIAAVASGAYDSALSVESVRNFCWIDGAPANYDPASISRTQDLSPIHFETSSFYVFLRSVFTEHQRRVGFNPKLIEVSKIEALDVDEAIDFAIADAVLLSQMRSTNTPT